MKTFFKIIGMTLMVALLATGGAFGQQLPQFSQYMFNGLHINPGYAGYKGDPYLQSTYRTQWIRFPGSPETFTVTADLSANEGRMGFGVSLMGDHIGPTQTNSALLTYAYRIQTGQRSFLGLGLSAGVSEYSIDGSELDPNYWPDQFLPEGRVNMFTPNMNTGLFFHNDKFYAGFSVYNLIGKKALLKEDITLAYHDFHYYLTMGALFDFGSTVKFKPSFLIKEVKGAPTNYDLNAMFLLGERIWLGGSYRSNMKIWNNNLPENLSNRNSFALITEIFPTDRIRIGYAYDHNLNVLQDYRTNSHELSVGLYLTPRVARMKNQRWF